MKNLNKFLAFLMVGSLLSVNFSDAFAAGGTKRTRDDKPIGADGPGDGSDGDDGRDGDDRRDKRDGEGRRIDDGSGDESSDDDGHRRAPRPSRKRYRVRTRARAACQQVSARHMFLGGLGGSGIGAGGIAMGCAAGLPVGGAVAGLFAGALALAGMVGGALWPAAAAAAAAPALPPPPPAPVAPPPPPPPVVQVVHVVAPPPPPAPVAIPVPPANIQEAINAALAEGGVVIAPAQIINLEAIVAGASLVEGWDAATAAAGNAGLAPGQFFVYQHDGEIRFVRVGPSGHRCRVQFRPAR